MMKKTLMVALCVFSINANALACGMSIFGNPLILPLLFTFAVVDGVNSQAHTAKASLRKLPEYQQLKSSMNAYLDCAEHKHNSCSKHDFHKNFAQPHFLKMTRKQDQMAWASLLYDMLSKNFERFANLPESELEKLSPE